MENPYMIDPIYGDLEKDAKNAEGQLASEQKSLEEAQKALKELKPRDVTRGHVLKEISIRQKNVVQLSQAAEYARLLMERRKAWDEDAYLKAFNAGKPWPDHAELVEYRELRKLQSASRNWDDRVPKNHRYEKKNADTDEKKPEKAEKGGHGEGGEHAEAPKAEH